MVSVPCPSGLLPLTGLSLGPVSYQAQECQHWPHRTLNQGQPIRGRGAKTWTQVLASDGLEPAGRRQPRTLALTSR